MYYVLRSRQQDGNEIHKTVGKAADISSAISMLVDAVTKLCRKTPGFPQGRAEFQERLRAGFGENALGQKCWADPTAGAYFEILDAPEVPGQAQESWTL